MRSLVAALSAAATLVSATGAVAQPLDPYGDPPAPPKQAPPLDPYDDPPPADPPPGAVSDERDPEVDEAVAASLVARARELIALEKWQDAQQLLGEAVARSPDGAAAAEARPLLEQVNARLGITRPAAPATPSPVPDTRTAVVQVPDYDLPPGPSEAPRAGRRFILHTTVIGAVLGGMFFDAATVDTRVGDGDPVDTEEDGAVVGGVLLGALGGLAVGALVRNNEWMTRDDVVVIDSFAAIGLVASLDFGAILKPAHQEAYSINGIFGLGGGAVAGWVIAKRNDLSARRMKRVDLWAGAGAVAPWLVFAAADGDEDGARVAGLLSLAGLVGGAWIGFRTTRGWDDRDEDDAVADAPPALLRRDSTGAWSLGAPGLRPSQDPRLGEVHGRGVAADLLGGRW